MTDSRTTPLDDLHRALGARMVPFAGYAMPLQYPAGILAEHRHTRAAAGLFDVSHMGQVELSGPGVARWLERLVPGDIEGLAVGRVRYTVFTNEEGGILDDLMVAKLAPDHLSLVVNAACRQADIDHLSRHLDEDLTLAVHGDRALLALQGPAAAAVLARLAPECAAMLARLLLEDARVMPVGLGARDSLRLEAGLCLYGADIDTATTPIEADLAWIIGRRRREQGGFPGAARILGQLAAGPERLRVGIRPDGRAPARAHTAITDTDGRPLGEVTSGGFSPSLDAPIAMGYVAASEARPGTQVFLDVRGRSLPARIVSLPFVAHRYHKA